MGENAIPLYVIRKRGYFYRPNARGYTTRIEEAGRYTEAEAKMHVSPGSPGFGDAVTMHLASEFPAKDPARRLIEEIAEAGFYAPKDAPDRCNRLVMAARAVIAGEPWEDIIEGQRPAPAAAAAAAEKGETE